MIEDSYGNLNSGCVSIEIEGDKGLGYERGDSD